MSNAPALSAAPSESTDLVAAEADYEALTEALMQTRRGRWFLAEHARRCRQMDQADLVAALGRVEQAITESREPVGLTDIREQLGALARIEQTLAENREPAGLTELNEKLDALPRIEQALADYRDPPSIAELREGLSVLPRIEQALADSREPAGIAELREHLSAVTQAVADVRAEVIAQRPADSEAADIARARDEEMLRLLQEQRERLDALADIWARAQPGPAAPPPAPTPSEPQPEAAKPLAISDLDARDVSLDATPVMLDTPISEPDDVAAVGIAGADSRHDRSEAGSSEPYGIDIPTSELLDRAVSLEIDIDAEPAEELTHEPSAFEQPDYGGAAHIEAPARVSDDDDEPIRPVAIDPVIAIIVASEGAIDTSRGLRPRVGEVAPEELRQPEPAHLPAWLVGTPAPESPTAPEPAAQAEAMAAPPEVTASAPQPGPELTATEWRDETAEFVLQPAVTLGEAVLAASPEPAPEPETEFAAPVEAELILEFEPEPESEPESELEAALAGPPDAQAEPDHTSATEDKAEAISTFEREADPPIAPDAGPSDVESEPDVVAGPALESDIAEQDRPAPAAERATTANPDVVVVRALGPASDPHADVVWESAPEVAPEAHAQPSAKTENEFNPANALAELRRILGLAPGSPPDQPEPASPGEAGNMPASETLEEALADDVIEELPAQAAPAGHQPAVARLVPVASDPLDPVRALSEEERIALFS